MDHPDSEPEAREINGDDSDGRFFWQNGWLHQTLLNCAH